MELQQKFIDELVAFLLALRLIVFEVPGHWDLNGFEIEFQVL